MRSHATLDPAGWLRLQTEYSISGSWLKLRFPMQRKKFEAILRHVAKPFEHGLRYSENHVNEILSQYHEDTAALRRGLVDIGLMARDHGVYWRQM